jgi:hypothetical protein
MRQLIYSSSAVRPFSDLELKQLLVSSRSRNLVGRVTGLLIHYSGTFLQVLEGADEHVMTTYERIARDPRHRKVTILDGETEIQSRAFGAWTMGFHDLTGNARHLKGFVELRSGFGKGRLNRAEALRLLQSMPPTVN